MGTLASCVGTIVAALAFSYFWEFGSSKEKVLESEIHSMPITLDPIYAADSSSISEVSKVYEGLLEYHYLKRPTELIPNLAQDMPHISNDGLTYTFKIKQGIHFQDDKCFPGGKGRELTSHDIVYSFMRLADPRSCSHNYILIEDMVAGLDEWRSSCISEGVSNYSTIILGIKVIDEYTVRFMLKKPSPKFLHLLAMSCTFIVPKEAVDFYKDNFKIHPVGTGPFMIKDFDPRLDEIIAVKNPTFRDKFYPSDASEEFYSLLGNHGKKLPFIDKIRTRLFTNGEFDRTMRFNLYNIDIAIFGISAEWMRHRFNADNEVFKDTFQSRGVTMKETSVNATCMYVFNNNVSPFKENKFLRRAMSMAYDREKANRLFHSGKYIIAHSPIPPCIEGHEKKFVNEYNQYDLEEAKELMIKAGYPEGQGLSPITLDFDENCSEEEIKFFQECMCEIGIEIICIKNAHEDLLYKIDHGETQIHYMIAYVEYPDCSSVFSKFSKKDKDNIIFGNYSNDKCESLFEQSCNLVSLKDKIAIYDQMQKIISEDVPVMCVFYPTNMNIHHEYVENFEYFEPKKYDLYLYLDIDVKNKRDTLHREGIK